MIYTHLIEFLIKLHYKTNYKKTKTTLHLNNMITLKKKKYLILIIIKVKLMI